MTKFQKAQLITQLRDAITKMRFIRQTVHAFTDTGTMEVKLWGDFIDFISNASLALVRIREFVEAMPTEELT